MLKVKSGGQKEKQSRSDGKYKSGEMARALRSVSPLLIFVRVEGLEPPSLAAPDPKSGVSTNFTTPAFGTAKVCKN